MKRTATSIGDVTKNIIGKLAKNRCEKEKKILGAWRQAAGERYCEHTQPVSLRRKELVVNVESSGWLYDLTMRKQEISEKLKKRLKDDFGKVRFRIGEIEK
jgi:predicted nucleic acid-binding Zn ribbon protein